MPTNSDTSGHTLRSLLLIVPASVLSCLLTVWIVKPAAPAPGPPQPDVASERLLQQLDELRQRVEEGFRDLRPASSSLESQRKPVPESGTTAEMLSEITDRLDRLWSAARTGFGGSREPLQRDVPINWGEIDRLKALGLEQWQTAQASAILMTPAQVIARFGFPTQIQSSERNDMIWFYLRDEASGIPEATIRFNGGFVVGATFAY